MKPLAELFLNKVLQSLAGAQREFAVAAYDKTANRCYYACYQAAVALLIEIDQFGPLSERHDHDEFWAKLSAQAIRQRKIVRSEYAQRVQELLSLRRVADYSETSVNQRKAQRVSDLAREFCADAERYLRKAGL